MKSMNRILSLAVCLVWVGNLPAQQITASAGGSASNANLSCTFVIGQMVAPTEKQSEYVFYPAVLFPSGNIITAIPEIIQNNEYCYVTDNEILHIAMQSTTLNDTYCEIFNILGATYFNGKIKMQKQEISLVNYPTGIYVIVFKKEKQIINTFKFIKR
jgi:hypothetical protein